MTDLIVACGHDHTDAVRCRDCALECGSADCKAHVYATESVQFTESAYREAQYRPFDRYCRTKMRAKATVDDHQRILAEFGMHGPSDGDGGEWDGASNIHAEART